MMKALLLLALFCIPGLSFATPFLVSDPTTQTVTHCGYLLDSATKVDIPVVSVTGGKICKIDLQPVSTGTHSIKLTFVNIDPVWGRSESVETSPFSLTRPSSTVTNTPAGLAIIP